MVPKEVATKINSAYISSRHAQDQYCSFSFQSLALVFMINDYYHFIMVRSHFLLQIADQYGSPSEPQCPMGNLYHYTMSPNTFVQLVSPVLSLKEVMMIFIILRGCTTTK